jgi:hypothetical protein
MPTNTINFKDKTFQTTDLPQNIQQTVLFYDAAIEAQKAAEIELVIASSASKQLLSAISAQIEQWEAAEEAAAAAAEVPTIPDTSEDIPVDDEGDDQEPITE